MKLPKLLIIGHGRHGKDTVCEILKDAYGFKFNSSSYFCAQKFIFQELKDKYNYKTFEECYADRHNRRSEWYNMIHNYCKDDHARLGREIFREYDIYCGLRNKAEFHAMKNSKVFDYAIWVDRSDLLPIEDRSSMTLEPWMADFVIDNNGSMESLANNITSLIQRIIREHAKTPKFF